MRHFLLLGNGLPIHVCKGFVYDHGGESNYFNLTRDTITLDFGDSDSAYHNIY